MHDHDSNMTHLIFPDEIIIRILLHLASVQRLEHVLPINRRFNQIASSPGVVLQCINAIANKEPCIRNPPLVKLLQSYPRWACQPATFELMLNCTLAALSWYYADEVHERLRSLAMHRSAYVGPLGTFCTLIKNRFPTYTVPYSTRRTVDILKEIITNHTMPHEGRVQQAIAAQNMYEIPFIELQSLRYESRLFWEIFGAHMEAVDVLHCATSIVYSDFYDDAALSTVIWRTLRENVRRTCASPNGPLVARFLKLRQCGSGVYGTRRLERFRKLFPRVTFPATWACFDILDHDGLIDLFGSDPEGLKKHSHRLTMEHALLLLRAYPRKSSEILLGFHYQQYPSVATNNDAKQAELLVIAREAGWQIYVTIVTTGFVLPISTTSLWINWINWIELALEHISSAKGGNMRFTARRCLVNLLERYLSQPGRRTIPSEVRSAFAASHELLKAEQEVLSKL